jgi:hypothetical protein
MSAFIYIQTVDTGLAPCVFRGIWSLALCKPTIRRRAGKGDIIIAVTPAKDGHRLSSWAKIKQQIATDKFATKYSKKRHDNIYTKLSDGKYIWRSDVRHTGHKSKAEMEHDLGKDRKNAFVLIAKDFFAFGENALELQKWTQNLPQLRNEIGKLGRSFRRNFSEGADKELKKLERLLKNNFSRFHKKNFKPRNPGLNLPCETKTIETKYTCFGRKINC